jgi:hypothetical protein
VIKSEYLEYGGFAREIIHKSFCVRIELLSRRSILDQILPRQSALSEMTIRAWGKDISLPVFCLAQIHIAPFCFSVMTDVALRGCVAVCRPRIAAIRVLIDRSERTAKGHSRQTIDTDYSVFTDNPELRNNGP